MIEHVIIPEERIKKLKGMKKWKEELGYFLNVDVEVGEDVIIDGDTLRVLRAKEIIKAFGRGFSLEECLDLLDEDYALSVIDMKQSVGKSRNRQVTMKGRVIGEEGRTKKTIEKCANVKICVYGKTVGIIGKPENIKIAEDAIGMILSGSKHNSVYRFLNEHKVV